MMSNKEIASGSGKISKRYLEIASELQLNSGGLRSDEKAAASLQLVKGSVQLAFSEWENAAGSLLQAVKYFDSQIEDKDLKADHLRKRRQFTELTVLAFPFIGCSYIGPMDWKAVKALKYLMFFNLMAPKVDREALEVIKRLQAKYTGVRDIEAVRALTAVIKSG